jgi:aerobic-type carbon monoxide dehydrogenase small subunit (CoxS/CutS family)
MKNITLRFTLNGKEVELDCAPNKRMLDVLRGDLAQTGTKEGCAVGECGACTVISTRTVASCLVARQMQGATS